MNLIALLDSVNSRKSAQPAIRWMVPNRETWSVEVASSSAAVCSQCRSRATGPNYRGAKGRPRVAPAGPFLGIAFDLAYC